MEHIDARWRKSSHSGTSGNNCVEASNLDDRVGVRDSSDRNGAVLRFTRDAWRSFTEHVRATC